MVKEAMLPRDGNRGREDSKDGVFTPILALSRMMGKIFLPHPCPLGPYQAPPHFIKLYFLLIFLLLLQLCTFLDPLKYK